MKKGFPTILILFGITGDLAQTKVIPSLYKLYSKNLLPELFTVIGFGRRELSEKQLHTLIYTSIKQLADSNSAKAFAASFKYHKGDFSHLEDYVSLANKLGFTDKQWNTCANKLFYLAVPPNYYDALTNHLHDSGLTQPCGPDEGWTRVLIEKPFGTNKHSARKLDTSLGRMFKEEQIYRIDHYLAKEMMQNILAFRFSNNLLEDSWNNNTVEQIKIRFIENEGVETRGAFYDGIGALRDVGQNHLLQMLALTTMEQPQSFSGNDLRVKREEVLNHLISPSSSEIASHTFRAQYSSFRAIEGVSPTSTTETYFKLITYLNTPRWNGVPITLEGGKGLKSPRKEIKLIFKPVNSKITTLTDGLDYKNRIVINLETGEEGINIRFWAKKPGLTFEFEEATFEFDFTTSKSISHKATGYEKLLLDAIEGNQELFITTKEAQSSWDFIDPIIEAWQKDTIKLYNYDKNSNDILNIPEF